MVTSCIYSNYVNANFNFWMSKGSMKIGLFKVHEIMRLSMAKQLCILFEKYNLMHHVIAFVKDESNNLTSMATTLCFQY